MTSLQPGRIDLIDASPGDEVPASWALTAELGLPGLRRTSGYVDDEFLPQLRGRKAVKVFREISDNSPVIGAFLMAVQLLLRGIEYNVEPGSSRGEDRRIAEHVEQCKDDMDRSWGDMILEIASFIVYGWELSEINYKRRMGPWYSNRANFDLHRSKFDDGLVGWHSISGRAQETMLRWVFGPRGEILAMVQMAPPRYEKRVVPLEKSLLFRTTTAKNNPEGRSLLRNTYQPWYYLKRHQEIEAVGVARDLAGMPMAQVPSKILQAAPGTQDAAMLDAIKRLVQNVARNENEGIVWPRDIDPETKQSDYEFSLLNSGGSRQFDTESIIARYKTEMLQAVLADFIQVGHENNGGSYALHTDKSGLFRSAVNALAQIICDEFNRKAIPQLLKLNGWKPKELPHLVPNNVDPPDLTQLGAFLQQTGALGVQWFPDPTLEKFLRDAAGLPKLDPALENALQMQQRQQVMLNIAQQRLQAVQVDQQAAQGEMTMQQQAMGLQQQQQQLEAPQGEQGDPGDPDGAHAQAQAGEATNQAKLTTQQQQVKLAQEKQKLANLKRPAASPAGRAADKKAPAKKTAARKPIKKAYRYLPYRRPLYDGHPDVYLIEESR